MRSTYSMNLMVMQAPVSPVPSSILLIWKVGYDSMFLRRISLIHMHSDPFVLLQINQASGLTTERILVTNALSQTAFARRKRDVYV